MASNAYTVAALTVLGRGLEPPKTPRAQHIEVALIVGGGLLTASSLVAFATGRTKTAYMLGICGALAGAVISAARVFGGTVRS